MNLGEKKNIYNISCSILKKKYLNFVKKNQSDFYTQCTLISNFQIKLMFILKVTNSLNMFLKGYHLEAKTAPKN